METRIITHNSGKGSKYTWTGPPVALKINFEFENKSEASKAEYMVKKLSRNEKLRVIGGATDGLH